jgi:hypothetical protein
MFRLQWSLVVVVCELPYMDLVSWMKDGCNEDEKPAALEQKDGWKF